MMKIFYVLGKIANYAHELANSYRSEKYSRYFKFENVSLGDVHIQASEKQLLIGKGTYINGGRLICGESGKIIIGENCCVGYNLFISTITHSSRDIFQCEEADVKIGNRVWIGNNVVIREGVVIGDDAIIGANSVVANDVESNQIVGGVPAKLIRNR